MATVYLAWDLRHDRPVALKVLHPELAATLGWERFQRETRLAARLQHPHILSVYDSGEAVGQLWFTMPYVDGESLRNRLDRETELPVDDALRITREVADALAYAHAQGIVHRDIKPENILLSRGHALVADFGIARALDSSATGRLTETGMAVGTPAYMSPEQALGERALDGRSDLYSLGCVLYEMLAGEAPYTGPSPRAITAKRLSEPVPSVRRLRETVPLRVEQALQCALAKAPADRFPSVEAFVHAFDSTLSEAGTPLQPPVPGARRTNRIKAVVVAATTVVLLLIAGVIYLQRREGAPDSAGRKMLAVLPFKNLGAAADQYFADGLTEELTSRLASVAGLRVISRTSAEQYRNTDKPSKQIGRALGADYLLEGSVRWEKTPDGRSRVRVTPQLIQVSDDSHLWAERYDADLANVFQVQASIAEQVTSALGVALAPRERAVLGAQPTANLSAYDAYLRGQAANPWDFTVGAERIISGLRRAVEYYTEAVRLDSTFALAFAQLGSAQVALASWQVDPEQNALGAQVSIARALRLAPDLADAHGAAGVYHLLITHETEKGLSELERARALRPNDTGALSAISFFEWKMRGPQGRSVQFAEQAVVLDPQSNTNALNLAGFYLALGRYKEADRLYDRVIERDPRNHGPYVMKAFLYLLRDGDTLRARRIIRSAAVVVDSMALITAAATSGSNIGPWATLGMLDEPYQRALLSLSPAAFGDDTAYYGTVKGYAFLARGQTAKARAYYDTAQQVAERRLSSYPADPRPLGYLMWTHAVDGRAQQAYTTLERLLNRLGLSYFPQKHAYLARMALFAGDTQRAITELETKQWGSEVTLPWLCVDHFWDPLRSQPRFNQLVAGRCPAHR